MIRGVGLDLCQKDRFLKHIPHQKFLSKIFHPKELDYLLSQENSLQKSAYLASRWAAKESLVKALGLGLFDVDIAAMALVSQPAAAPAWFFEKSVGQILKKRGIKKVFSSISYEANLAAVVTIVEG